MECRDNVIPMRHPELLALVRSLSVVIPQRWLNMVILDWAIVAIAIAVCEKFWSWPLYVLAIVIIGSRQHGLAILMHEAVHYRFTPNKFCNDLVANLLTSYPLLVSLERYRDFHLKHHKHTNGPGDPERISLADPSRRPPFSPLSFWLYIMIDLIGLTSFRVALTAAYFSFIRKPCSGTDGLNLPRAVWSTLQRPLFTVLAIVVILETGCLSGVVTYWLIPMGTYLNAVLRIRSLAEHQSLPSRDNLDDARNVMVGPVAAFFLAPHNVSLHLTHHLQPSVPCYNLARMHEALVLHSPEYEARGGLSLGYLLGPQSVRSALIPRSGRPASNPQ